MTSGDATSPCQAASSLAAEAELVFQQRQRLEAEMEALASFLTSDGMPGLRGSLVDSEGFPRADIDVYALREARHRLACLQTDYREIQRRLEGLLFRMHAESAKSGTEHDEPVPCWQPQSNESSARQEDIFPPLLEVEGPAFAVVDVVQPGSPSSAAGLICGDRIMRLGCLRLPSTRTMAAASGDLGDDNSRNQDNGCNSSPTIGDLFRTLPEEVEHHKDGRMPVVVQRGSRVISLWLTPREWEGRGLLGCHLKPLPQE